MINPDKETFKKLSKNYDIIPLFKTVPADLETPISLYLKLAVHSGGSFLLESGELGGKNRYSLMGSDVFLTIYTLGSDTIVQGIDGKRKHVKGDPLDVLEKTMKDLHVYHPEELSGFWGGAVGYLSYDMVSRWEKTRGIQEETGWPSCYFYFPRKVFIYDHRQHLLTAVCLTAVNKTNDDPGKVYDQASGEMKSILGNIDAGLAHYSLDISSAPTATKTNQAKKRLHEGLEFTRDSFIAAVEKAKEYIRAGDIFQVVLSRRAVREVSVHPFNIYRALRSLNPSPYQFYLSMPDFQLVGSSPEMLVKLENGMAHTKPIAGTRPRGQDIQSDLYLAEELSKDEKERAEHRMLVDLGRNDLGKVCCYGSVEVTKLMQVEYFSHVMHLVSEVRGKVDLEYNFAHLLRAAFPAGTVSGAPKTRAMEIIGELEPIPRGPYAGAVGYIGFNGDMDTCITIRTILMSEGQAYIQAGAGIVADSEPVREYEETEHKMASSLRALSLAEEWANDFNYR